MEDLLKAGKAKSIGVSNFSRKKLEEEILPYATIVPAVDQVGALISDRWFWPGFDRVFCVYASC